MLEVALTCLALNIYHEARSEPELGMYAVAAVTLNRSKKQKKDICDVVFAESQFSWTIGNLVPVRTPDGKVGFKIKPSVIPRESMAWRKAQEIARKSFYMKWDAFGATEYHANYVKPYWRKNFVKVLEIGNHIFYAKRSTGIHKL